jgi:putative molybdopterin biosynthesis protein
MAVGVAVASALVDAGLGVRAAAKALRLDFIPVASEQYDLLFLREFYESRRGTQLLAVLRSGEFKSAVASLGGYDPQDAGKVLFEQ